jgi:Carboxypeptidase regulatory-like domain
MKAYPLFAVFLLLGSRSFIESQQPLVGTIEGTLKTQQGLPIPYASLTITNIDSVEAQSARQSTDSDKHGWYEFVDVPEGRYALVVKRNGYRDRTIPLLNVYPGQSVRMPVIQLSPAPPSQRLTPLPKP